MYLHPDLGRLFLRHAVSRECRPAFARRIFSWCPLVNTVSYVSRDNVYEFTVVMNPDASKTGRNDHAMPAQQKLYHGVCASTRVTTFLAVRRRGVRGIWDREAAEKSEQTKIRRLTQNTYTAP